MLQPVRKIIFIVFFFLLPHNKQPTAGGDFILFFYLFFLLLKGHVKLKSNIKKGKFFNGMSAAANTHGTTNAPKDLPHFKVSAHFCVCKRLPAFGAENVLLHTHSPSPFFSSSSSFAFAQHTGEREREKHFALFHHLVSLLVS